MPSPSETLLESFHNLLLVKANDIKNRVFADGTKTFIASNTRVGELSFATVSQYLKDSTPHTIETKVVVEDIHGNSAGVTIVYNMTNNTELSRTVETLSNTSPVVMGSFYSFINGINTTASIPGIVLSINFGSAVGAKVNYQINGGAAALNMVRGAAIQLTVSPNPGYPIRWQSQNTTVATISNSGQVVANSPGTSVITGGPFTDGIREYLNIVVIVTNPT